MQSLLSQPRADRKKMLKKSWGAPPDGMGYGLTEKLDCTVRTSSRG
jgi:hypothetical protein